MINQINRTLNKEILNFKKSFTQLKSQTEQDTFNLLAQLQLNLQESFSAILNFNQSEKYKETKNELKKKKKIISGLKNDFHQKSAQLMNQNDQLKKELQRSKKKINELLQVAQKCDFNQKTRQGKFVPEKGVQCEMKDVQLERTLEECKKQNILLKQNIIELQQIIDDQKEEMEAANCLIKQLIKQLQTNIADRQTWYGNESSNSSEIDSMKQQNESIQSTDSMPPQNFDEYQIESIQEVACQGDLNEDISTVDGSNTTKKDFALPEWLQFDEISKPPFLRQKFEENSNQMWPELLWHRMRQLLGLSYDI